ncbi:PQQ-binding-like beta-propeller repeat protein [Halobaculum litoreum]|uniref:outer membrane protein assembly factor BamB family protein n=1 Tax=Halobaculum litoreum TaxID=3031998 RepID=UPI0024C36B07|nr:PQQ-binding-like beta-propeller repeat protein [Halobaculum sp. DT92]
MREGTDDGGGGRHLSRRRLLAAVGTAGSLAVAGCSSVDLDAGVAATPLWRRSLAGGHGASAPVGTDDAVFVGAGDRSLHAFDAESGDARYRFATGGPIEARPAVAADGSRVFVHSTDGDLYAVDAGGDEAWRIEGRHSRGHLRRAGSLLLAFDPSSDTARGIDPGSGTTRFRRAVRTFRFPGLTPSVLVVPIQAPGAKPSIAALDTADGSIRWEAEPQYAYVATDGDRVAIAADEVVRVRSIADGTLRWETTLADPVRDSFGVGLRFDGDLYARVERGDDDAVVALDGATGEVRWRRSPGYEIERVLPGPDGVVVASSVDVPDGGIVVRVDRFDHDGTRRWTRTTDVHIGGTVETHLRVGGLVVVGSDHRIRALDAADGRPRWSFEHDYSRLGTWTDGERLFVSFRDDGGVARLPTV